MTKSTRYFMAGSAAVMAVGLCTGLVAFYGGGFQPVWASSVSTELVYVPADATLVAYADVRSIMDSELRQQLKLSIPTPTGQQEFQDKTGIDIDRDIDYVVAAMTSVDSGRPSGLVVARGRFDAVTLEALAREHGGTVEEYKGKRLINSPADNTEQITLAFLEAGPAPALVAVGSASAVRHAIDAATSATSITSNDEMMNLVKDIETGNNAWAVGRFDVLVSRGQLPQEVAQHIPPVKWFAAAGHINGGVSGLLRAEANDEESAQRLRDVVRGFLALAQLQGQNDQRIASLASSMQLSGDGKTVALSFSVPAEILQLMTPKVPAVQ